MLGFTLWELFDTLKSIAGEHVTSFTIQGLATRRLIWSFLIAALLTTPLVAMQLAADVSWDYWRIGFMGLLLLGAWSTYDFLSKRSDAIGHRAGSAVTVFALSTLIWVSVTVGILRDHQYANAMSGLVILTGFIGSVIARHKLHGMAWTMLAMAIAQALVPLTALTLLRTQVPTEKQFFGETGLVGVAVVSGFFVTLFVVSAVLFWLGATMSRTRSRDLTGFVLLGLLLGSVGSASAQSDSPLPAPTGPHKIGRASLHWKDEARDELETSAPDDKRELMVHLFYPTDVLVTGEPAVYVADADAMARFWDDSQLARVKAMRTHSIENAPLPSGDMRYPVVVFSPGGGLKALTYQALLEDLASHGWVVAAIDPPYNALALRMPDGRVLGDLPPNERGWPQPRSAEESQRFYKERVVHWARDISFVIDQLTALDKGSGPFANRLDLERGVGALGHSRGGQAAATVRILDSRVRGGVNLDGMADDWAVIPVKADETDVGESAFLWIQKPLPSPPTDEQLQQARRTREWYDGEFARIMDKWRRQMSAISGGALRLSMKRPGIAHIDFSDEPYWDGSMTEANRSDRLQTTADTRRWVRGFFDGTVRGEWTNLKRLIGDAEKLESDVTVHAFGKISP